ncbi:hypothetical protein DFQ27_000177 [Actinomortierella ambigua]|uniref:PNPLA domain-containing protein n=1 Tax=Actinomortierella ambigua TaxID=1343610 RepID=A0A9P6PPG3_9FUNG|nr:hypothetical protein DFQ27_000177 [Actinomortierella ambigua]
MLMEPPLTHEGHSVGVVVGGGGARGIAHLDVIWALEEAGIPVGIVGGTSIGSLMRGMYSREADQYCDTDRSFWNNALGYWGYLFYLSKFYEVVDTIIILKGCRSSLLQTYHHAGAMITMWSGVHYQATSIWIFVV